jgi:hypothetical protein
VGKTIGDKEFDLAAKEGTFAFHTVTHNQSFQSIECTSTIIRKVFEPKFTCAQTKVRAIVVNVLAPLSTNQIREDLKDAKFISVMIDSSNHKHTKLVPILVHYFVPQKAVKIKILEFANLSAESSAQLTEHTVHVLEEAKLIDKVVSLSADNTQTSGGTKGRGKNNVFERIRNKIERDIICVGGAVHNAVQTAADYLLVDTESIISKTYQYFHIYTVPVQTLKDFCDFVDAEYKNIIHHTKTRRLSPNPDVKRIVVVYPDVASYFLSIQKCPTTLKNFFFK